MSHGSATRSQANDQIALRALQGLVVVAALLSSSFSSARAAPPEHCGPTFGDALDDILDEAELELEPTRQTALPPFPPGREVGDVHSSLHAGLFVRGANLGDSLLSEFEAIGIAETEIHLIVGVQNIDTVREAGRAIPKKRLHHLAAGTDAQVDAAMTSMFARYLHGKFVIFVGHAEGDTLVLRSASAQPLAELPLSKLEDMATKNGARLLVIACDAACSVGSGSMGAINTLDAVQRISSAVKEDNLYDFLKSVASDDFQLVVDQSLGITVDTTVRKTVRGHFEETVTSATPTLAGATVVVAWTVLAGSDSNDPMDGANSVPSPAPVLGGMATLGEILGGFSELGDDSAGACSCRATTPSSAPLWGLLFLACLPGRSRRGHSLRG